MNSHEIRAKIEELETEREGIIRNDEGSGEAVNLGEDIYELYCLAEKMEAEENANPDNPSSATPNPLLGLWTGKER